MNAQDAKAKCPPAARIEDVAETIHGTVVHDPYRWLEEQDSPETRAWIEAENACTQAVLSKVPGQDAIARRLGELIKVDTIRLPIERGGRYFYAKRAANQDLFVLYMRRGAKGAEEVLVDPAKLSADHTTSVNFEGISDDGKLIGYGVRKGGEDEVSLHFLDTDTGKERKDVLPRARYISSPTFRKDKSWILLFEAGGGRAAGLFSRDGNGSGARHQDFWRRLHAGQDSGGGCCPRTNDICCFRCFYGSACDRSEVYFQDLKIAGPVTPVVNTLDGCFQGAIANDTLYLQTNWKAPKWRVVAVPLRTPSQEHWKEIIPEGESRMEDFRLAGGKIVAQYSHNAASELKIFQVDGTPAGGVALPQLGTVAGIAGRWKSNEVFFSFQSFAIPATVYRYDLARARRWTCGRNRRCRLIASAFELKQVWYESKDKTRVPMFLFYKKGLRLDGANPALMTAYGGFDVSETPQFRDDAVLWVEHGGVFALPSLRGGGEFGEDWHRAGMLEKKQNVFDDFYAAAEWLIANQYTRAEKLAITGRSNGGLLMGAAMTQRPELFRRDCVRLSVAGYGALSEFFGGEVLGAGVRVVGGCGAVPCASCLFALSPCDAGDEISRDFVFDRRQRYAGGSFACAEDDGGSAGGAGRG